MGGWVIGHDGWYESPLENPGSSGKKFFAPLFFKKAAAFLPYCAPPSR
jgi:hypothetical protein